MIESVCDIDSKNSIAFKRMKDWCVELQGQICQAFENIELHYKHQSRFEENRWSSDTCKDGLMKIMRGKIFEKVGINTSYVSGRVSKRISEFKEFGLSEGSDFAATGISLVAHMQSPLIPSFHMNTRIFVSENKFWFGGCADINPSLESSEETEIFLRSMKEACDSYEQGVFEKFQKQCKEYFYIKHRDQCRCSGGVFFDHLNSNDFEKDFLLCKTLGTSFKDVVSNIVLKKADQTWTDCQKKLQSIKRGLYVEFNLIYDRGTKFGLMSGALPEAVLMSMPPNASW